MSWNSSIQFAKLYKAYLTLSTTALTNPMIANLNMASYNINNVNTINAVAGTTLILYADPAQGVVVNTKMTLPNHPLVITNNTSDDSLQVHDNISDTSIFRVDNNGNVGIKSNASATLGHTLVVNGSGNFTSHINVPTLPTGTNDTQVATSAFVQTAIANAPRNISLQSSVIDIPASGSARFQTLTTATIANAFIFSSTTTGNAYVNLIVPTASQLASAFGLSAIIEFYIGILGVSIVDPSFPNVAINVNTASADNNSAWATNYTVSGFPPQNLQTSTFALMKDFAPNTARLFGAQYKVLITLQNGYAYYFFDYKGIG